MKREFMLTYKIKAPRFTTWSLLNQLNSLKINELYLQNYKKILNVQMFILMNTFKSNTCVEKFIKIIFITKIQKKSVYAKISI